MYVGQTATSIEKRFARHCWKSESKKNTPITLAIAKYGKENFKIERIDTAETLEEANQKEVRWAIELNTFCPNGYNLKAGGRKYFLMSEETKEKIRQANIGKKVSEETRKKLSESHKGFKVSEEAKRKLSDRFRGKPVHANTAHARAVKNKKLYILESPEGEIVKICGMKQFCKDNNFSYTNMCSMTSGKLVSYKGWTLVEKLGYNK